MAALFFMGNLNGQTPSPTHIWAHLTENAFLDKDELLASGVIQSILMPYDAQEGIAFPNAESEMLQKVLVIDAADPLDLPAVKSSLDSSGLFSLVEIEYEQEALGCGSPEVYNDPGALATDHIDNMELPCAWTITKGNPSVSIGPTAKLRRTSW